MKFRFIYFLLLLSNTILIQAQNLINADSICSTSDIIKPVFSNEIYAKWDFNKKTIQLINTVSSNISNNIYDMKIIKSEDQWFGFYTTRDLKKLFRFSYGNSITNTPIVDDLGDLNGQLTSPHGIDIILSNNIYYGVISNWSSQQPTLLKFENGLGQLPSIIPNKNIPNITNCSAVDLTLRGDSILAFFNSFSTKKITVVKFANDLSNASLNKTEFLNNNIQPVTQDILVEDNRVFLLNGQLNGTIGINNLDKNTLVNSTSIQVNQTFGNAWGAKIINKNNSILSFLNCSNNGFIYFNEIDLNSKTAINFQPLDVKQNGTFTSPLGLDYIRDSNGNSEYLFIHNNKDRKTYIYEVKENTSNWKQIEYTAFNTNSNTFVSRKDSIYIYPNLVSNFSIDNRCLENEFILTASINQNLLNNSKYRWKSVDFDTITTSNKLKSIFSVNGIKNIQLTVTDICNRKDSITKTVNVNSKKDISNKITLPLTLCTLSNSEFINSSTALQDSIIKSQWLLISNSTKDTIHTDTNLVTSYVFDTDSSYTLQLFNLSQAGCTTDTSITITPVKGPAANFLFQDLCLKDSLTIYNNSMDSTIISTTWFIDNQYFGNDTTFKLSNDSLKERNFKLITKNSAGCETEIVKSIKIEPLPISDFDSTYLCDNQNKQILNRSSIPDFTPISYQWFEGDSLVSNETNPTLKFNNKSVIDLILIATSINLCKDTISKKIHVLNAPIVNFEANNVCIGSEINLIDNSIDASNPISQRKWIVNNAILSGTNPKYIFPSTGDYTINLEVTNTLGCKASLDKNISVFNLPTSLFSHTQVCQGKSIQFYNNSFSNPKDSIKTSRWFYNGKSLLGDTVNFAYSSNPSDIVQLNVETKTGCFGTSSTRLNVAPSPKSEFDLSTSFGEPTLKTQTTNKSSNAISYIWRDNVRENISSSNSPLLEFSNYGIYELSLIATSISGCTDTSKKTIKVIDPNYSYSIDKLNFNNSNNSIKFNLEINNTGNIDLTNIPFEIDFGGQFSQVIWLNNLTFPPNSKTTVTLPFSILEANYDSYDYICIETTDSTIASSKSCILKGEKLNSIYLYPNPTKNLVNISYYIPKPQEIDLELFNIQGESLLSQNIPLNLSGKQSISINLEEYKSGIYILMIKTEDETLIHKIEKNQ